MKTVILDKIKKVLENPLSQKGFKLKNKTIFERINDKNQQEQYQINLSKNKGYFQLHLILKVIDKQKLKPYNEILSKTLTDNRYKFPPNWKTNDIEDSIKIQTKREELSSLSDWKCLKNENESLEDFNNRFSIWLHSFDELEEIENWQEQLRTSVSLIDKYFNNIDTEYIINDSIGKLLPMFLLKDNREKLNKYYQESREKVLSRNKEPLELDIFYEYLAKEITE